MLPLASDVVADSVAVAVTRTFSDRFKLRVLMVTFPAAPAPDVSTDRVPSPLSLTRSGAVTFRFPPAPDPAVDADIVAMDVPDSRDTPSSPPSVKGFRVMEPAEALPTVWASKLLLPDKLMRSALTVMLPPGAEVVADGVAAAEIPTCSDMFKLGVLMVTFPAAPGPLV